MSTDKPTNPLVDYLLQAKSPELMQEALTLLLTPAEYKEFNNRIRITDLLEAGVPQREIAKQLNVAIATVSRGARALKDRQHKQSNSHD